MAANTNEGGQNQVIMPRSDTAVAFFRSYFAYLAVLCGTFAILDAYNQYFSSYMTSMTISFTARICIVVVAAEVLAAKFIFMSIICSKCLQWFVRRLQWRPSESSCLLVGFMIRGICDLTCLDDVNDIFPLVVVSAYSSFLIFTIATSFGSDSSGITEGLLVQFGKMLVVYAKAGKLWQPIICALVLTFAIISMLTELADVGSDNSTALQQKNDSRGPIQTEMQRSPIAIRLFRFSTALVTGFWFIFTIICVDGKISSANMAVPVTMCINFVTAGIFIGGYTLYTKLLHWLSQRLPGRKDKWCVMLVVTAILDVFLDKHKLLPLALLSALSIITLCILNTGLEDCTGITDGLLIGFVKWLLIYKYSNLPMSVECCWLVLLFAVICKLSVCAGEAKVKTSQHAGLDVSTRSSLPGID